MTTTTSSPTSSFTPRRAVVFTSYTQQFFDNTARKKLERYNVDPIRIVNPSRERGVNMAGADIGIVLFELMDAKDAKAVIEKVRKQGRPCLALHRQIGQWQEAF